jgi:plastocyanin
MTKLSMLLTVLLLVAPISGYAETHVTEGDEAKKLYDTDKGKAQVLVQKNKIFILRAEGKEIPKPESISVKAGERFYIVNEEDTFVHNVYDTSDSSWVLRKQPPSNVAAVSFDNKLGKHSLRCAIHPTMKIEVNVVP